MKKMSQKDAIDTKANFDKGC